MLSFLWTCRSGHRTRHTPGLHRWSSVENFVDESLGPNIFHVHLQVRCHGERNVELNDLLSAVFALDTIINKGHQARCHDDTK